ncbi:hypothetical protein F5Y12DRAFT_714135 [Xylaria sp. FL1777]|nr:hypothetical protein F5Y12DRAFT_714135 [Xylaria sp. FL1777]
MSYVKLNKVIGKRIDGNHPARVSTAAGILETTRLAASAVKGMPSGYDCLSESCLMGWVCVCLPAPRTCMRQPTGLSEIIQIHSNLAARKYEVTNIGFRDWFLNCNGRYTGGPNAADAEKEMFNGLLSNVSGPSTGDVAYRGPSSLGCCSDSGSELEPAVTNLGLERCGFSRNDCRVYLDGLHEYSGLDNSITGIVALDGTCQISSA